MGISDFTLNRLYLKMKDFILNAKIDRIINISDTTFLFNLFKDGKCQNLLLSLDPTLPITLLNSSYHIDKINPPSQNCNLLKKYFERGIIKSFEKVENDRIFIFEVTKWTPSYQKIENKLIFEMFPLSPNIIITDLCMTIMDAFKKTESLDSKHPIHRGMKYLFPTALDKQFTSSTPIEELKGKVNKSELKYLETLNKEEYFNSLQSMFNETNYYLYKNDITSLKIHSDSLKLNMEELFQILIERKTFENKENKYQHIFKLVEQKIKSIRKRIINLENDKLRFDDASSYLEKGNLLYSIESDYHKGDKVITINDIKIDLDPKLDLNQNAQKYFKLYKKSKNGLIQVEKQKDIAKDELEYFERINTQIQHASFEDMKEIILDLCENHYIKDNKVINKDKKKPGNKKFTPHFIKSPSKTKIGYGLSSFQNEELTFSLASKDDIYLHIKDYHGPHVIIFNSSPNEDDLLFAGEIALYFASKTAGEVYYTQKRNVKKVPGKRGLAIMNTYKVMVINEIRESTLSLIRSR